MSLWGTLGAAVGTFFGGPLGGAIGGALGGAIGGDANKAPVSSIPGVGFMPQTQFPGLPSMGFGTQSPLGQLVHGSPASAPGAKKKHRRINPCNGRALNHALRRVKAYDKTRKRVDKALRQACPPKHHRAAPFARKCK